MKNKNKVIILFFTLFAYTIAYLLNSQPHQLEDSTQNSSSLVERISYTKILIKADSFTKFNNELPVQLTNKLKTKTVKNVFVIEELSDQFGENKKFWVDVPTQYINDILTMSEIQLHNNEINFKLPMTTKRVNYEIYY